MGQVQITPADVCSMKLGELHAPKRSDGMFCAHGATPHIDACGVSIDCPSLASSHQIRARIADLTALPISFSLFYVCLLFGVSLSTTAAQGDSGGGMLCMFNGSLAIVGIVSYGLTCGTPGMPGVYTEVAHHLDFIASVLNWVSAKALR